MINRRPPRSYDHRLRQLVYQTGDIALATRLGVPRSTASGWLRAEPPEVVSFDILSGEEQQLQAEVLKLRRRLRVLGSIVGLLLALLRLSGFRLTGTRLPNCKAKDALLRAVHRARKVFPLRSALRVLGLSPSRFHSWCAHDPGCHPEDQRTCPRRSPNQLTAIEVMAIKEMVTSKDYCHVPTSRLAILAQRLGKVFASPTTWARLVRERGWRRPRLRVHPDKPKVGLRTSHPDAAWHVDMSLVRLLDGSKVYIHAVIDNFSRRILSYRVSETFNITNAIAVLTDAVNGVVQSKKSDTPPLLVVDGGVENFNGSVDELVTEGLLQRVLALTDLQFSNSLIEAFWRTLKHQWLSLNTLDSAAAVRRQVEFYITAHNSQIPHSAFRGQTPNEIYFGKGEDIPGELEAAKTAAKQARLEANRAASCAGCSGMRHEGIEAAAA